MANTTWSPTRLTNVTLSGSNLIATATGVGCVVTADFQHSGKWYFEFTLNTIANAGTNFGLTTGAVNTATFQGSPVPGAIINKSGNWFVNNANKFVGIGALASGNVVCVAVDLGAALIWARLGAAGNWNGSASNNPATGVGGVDISPLGPGGGLNFYLLAGFGATSDQTTANFGGGAFTGAVPSGFTSGFTAGAVGLNAIVTQSALEEWITANPPAQVTQVALEEWITANPSAQLTQMALEMWASVANYVPPPYVPPPPSGGGTGSQGQGKDKGKGKGQKSSVPALRADDWAEDLLRRRRRRVRLAAFQAPITASALAESVSTAAALSATVIHLGALTASASTSDAIAGGRLLAALLAEGSTTSVALSALLGTKGMLSEGSVTAGTLSATAKMLAQLAASSATSDTPYHGVTVPGALSESAATSAAITAFLAAKAQLAEGSASSAAVAGFRTLVAALSEGSAGSAALSALLRHGASLAEGSASHDAVSATAKLLARLSEAAQAQDSPVATAILKAALAEAASTLDADTFVATTHPLRRQGKLIGERSTPDLEGEWREPGS